MQKVKTIIFTNIFLLSSVLFSQTNSYPLSLRITPNNDGKNDTFIYKCYNPHDFNVRGEIFDLYGKKIGNMITMSQTGYYYNLQWNPPQNIKGGIYIYQIIVGENRIKGAFIIVK